MSRAVDPGWGDAVKKLPRSLLPTRGVRMATGSADSLSVMRVLWLTFAVAMLLIGVVVVVIDQAAPGGGADGRVVAGVVAVVGVSLQLVSAKFVPEITGRSMNAVRESAQRAFFVRIAFAEPAALLGFMGFVLSGNVGVYAVGALIGLSGLVDAAPTTRWLDEGQQALRSAGSDVELLDALVSGGITR